LIVFQDLEQQKSDPLLFPAKASPELLQRMPYTVIIEAEFDFYLTETTRFVLVNYTHSGCFNNWLS
jgi:hypothetical protein